MDRLEMAIELINEVRLERDRLEDYKREYREAFEKDSTYPGYTFKNRFEVMDKYSPLPKKSVINDYLKMARRILLGEYMK